MPIQIENPISRDSTLAILRAALDLSAQGGQQNPSLLRFARQVALSWLATFPGDLQIGLMYARVLIQEKRPLLALPILEGLCGADPEFLEAQQLLGQVQSDQRAEKQDTLSAVLALSGSPSLGPRLDGGHCESTLEPAAWGRYVWLAYRSLAAGDLAEAEESIRQALAAAPHHPLPAVLHLRILEANPHAPWQARRSLAEFYLARWPDCLPCKLLLADWLMDGGESGQAVALLHQAAARDVSGQAAARLWGANHPYRPIWPRELALPIEAPIPAPVMAALGWNQLPTGTILSDPLQVEPALHPPFATPTNSRFIGDHESVQADPFTEVDLSWLDEMLRPVNPSVAEPVPASAEPLPASASAAPAAKSGPAEFPDDPDSEILLNVQTELEKLANQLNLPNIGRADGRFPVYLMLSIRSALEKQYGPQGCAEIEGMMSKVGKAIESRRGPGFRWTARLFFADDPTCTRPFGISPARPGDPWSIKLTLTDLDAALARQGMMIGAVLIVGGPEIVPFHLLPNPIDDLDDEVPSDNPYATRDENYFIPEWPVGRLPGGVGMGPALLVKSMQRIVQAHTAQARQQKALQRWVLRLLQSLRLTRSPHKASYGYTAAIWRKASISVYKPIGKPRSLMVSPPTAVNGSSLNLPTARMGYFNLHGLSDSAEWYGQRHPNEAGEGPDFPVALRPEDLNQGLQTDGHGLPEVVFSEACYGMNIHRKTIDGAMSLKFLSIGSKAVVGSTCMAYGSIDSPLIAADLLGHSFWNGLREGLPVGEALRRAKIYLAREMHHRQGYLDGEDQKTLISFVLYGDPLAETDASPSQAHTLFRTLKPPAMVKTVCDRGADPIAQPTPEVMAQVKRVVTRYLPGMADADLTISQEHAECAAHGHTCPTSQLGPKGRPSQPPVRRLVTLSKRFERNDHIHTQLARLTLDPQGNLVKLVVSR